MGVGSNIYTQTPFLLEGKLTHSSSHNISTLIQMAESGFVIHTEFPGMLQQERQKTQTTQVVSSTQLGATEVSFVVFECIDYENVVSSNHDLVNLTLCVAFDPFFKILALS